jgi:hypothetical protein
MAAADGTLLTGELRDEDLTRGDRLGDVARACAMHWNDEE